MKVLERSDRIHIPECTCGDRDYTVSIAEYVDAGFCIACDKCGKLQKTDDMTEAVFLRFAGISDITVELENTPLDRELVDVLKAVIVAATLFARMKNQMVLTDDIRDKIDKWLRKYTK